jgi:hypothetical protein
MSLIEYAGFDKWEDQEEIRELEEAESDIEWEEADSTPFVGTC